MIRRSIHLFLPFVLSFIAFAQTPPAPRVIDLKASDGTMLKATYFAAAKPARSAAVPSGQPDTQVVG
jgi:hypothetical protein